MSLDLSDVRLMVLTDRSQLSLGRGLVRTIAECVSVGLTHVVVRELDESESARAALVAALVDVGATVISARTLLPGAAGVHLASNISTDHRAETYGDPRLASHTSPMPPDWSAQMSFGRSCHSVAEVGAAAAEGAAYAFLSPYAAGGSKPGRTPLPAEAFAGHPIPVFALGGVAPANAAAARAAGAHGVAVTGAVMAAPDPARVVRALLEAVR